MTFRTGRSWQLPSWLPVFLVFFFLYLIVDKRPIDDDYSFSTLLQDKTLWEYTRETYLIWSGRVPLNALLVLLMPDATVLALKGIYAVAGGLYAFAVTELAFGRNTEMTLPCYCTAFGFFLIPAPVLREACFWMTGAGNYFLPVALGLVAALPLARFYRQEPCPRLLTGAGLIAASVSVFQEQCFAVMLGLELVACLYSCRVGKMSFYLQLLLAITLVLGLAGLLAPGNKVRYAQEILSWYPEFTSVSLPARILDAVHILFVALFQKHSFFTACFLTPLVGVLLGRWLRSRRPVYLVMTLGLVSLIPVYFGGRTIDFGAPLAPRPWSFFWGIFFVYGTAYVCCVGGALFLSFSHRAHGGMVALCWFAALASYLIMGFSPTIVASGPRTMFVMYTLFIVIWSCVLAELVTFSWVRKGCIGRFIQGRFVFFLP